MERRSQWALIVLLGLAMAVSHYSTTYVAVTILGLTLPAAVGRVLVPRYPAGDRGGCCGIPRRPVGAVLWYVPVTHSDSHVLEVAQTVQAQGLNFLPNRTPGGDLISAYLQGNTKTPISAAQYQHRSTTTTHQQAVHEAAPRCQPSAIRTARLAGAESQPKWRLGYNALSLGLLLVEQLANLLAALGALLMMLRREATRLARQIGLLARGHHVTAHRPAVQRHAGRCLRPGTSPTAGPGPAGGPAVLVFGRAGRLRKVRQSPLFALAARAWPSSWSTPATCRGPALGGLTSVNLANSGVAYEYSYTHSAGIRLGAVAGTLVQPGQLVYTDEYGQVPLSTVTDMQNGLFFDLTPQTLNHHAWIYATRTNIVNGRAFALYNEHLATYEFPAGFLNANYDLVFTDGSSEVFHR